MHITSAELKFNIPHSFSLKDKRKICRSLIEKTQHRFNVSVSEVATQDLHQTLTIGIVVVSGEAAHSRESIENIIRFMEEQTDAELSDVEIIEH